MKTIYKINKVVVIVNLILFLTIYFGMLFLPVTGIVQLVMFGIYCYKWQSVVEPLKKHFVIYGSLALLSLGLLFLSPGLGYWDGFSLISSMVLGGLLSLYFLQITRRQVQYLEETEPLIENNI